MREHFASFLRRGDVSEVTASSPTSTVKLRRERGRGGPATTRGPIGVRVTLEVLRFDGLEIERRSSATWTTIDSKGTMSIGARLSSSIRCVVQMWRWTSTRSGQTLTKSTPEISTFNRPLPGSPRQDDSRLSGWPQAEISRVLAGLETRINDLPTFLGRTPQDGIRHNCFGYPAGPTTNRRELKLTEESLRKASFYGLEVQHTSQGILLTCLKCGAQFRTI